MDQCAAFQLAVQTELSEFDAAYLSVAHALGMSLVTLMSSSRRSRPNSASLDGTQSAWYAIFVVRVSGSNSVVECDLAKVEVAGSNPVSRSIFSPVLR